MIDKIKNNGWAIGLGALCCIYFAIQPFDRHLADIFWIILSLTGMAFLAWARLNKQTLETPKPLQYALWLCAILPVVSIISYLASPITNLPINLLEPDLRWWLIIPIILAMRANGIGPKWLLVFLTTYTLATFISAGLETNWYSNLSIRANGDENAVPYGMFNATIAALLLTLFVSPYIKSQFSSKKITILIRTTILVLCALATLAAIASGTRAALILIPITIVFIYLLHYPLKKSIPIATGLVVLLITSVWLSPPNAVKSKMANAYDNTYHFFAVGDRASKLTSVGQRLEQWRESWCIFKITPITGSGPRSFSEAHQTYGGTQYCNATQYRDHGDYQAHSLYFNHLGTLGIIGVLSMGLWFAYSIRISWQRRNTLNPTIELGSSLMLVTILCFFVNGITLDLWFKNHVMDKHTLIWALPLLLIFYKQSESKKMNDENP